MADLVLGATQENGPGSKTNPIIAESEFNYEMPEDTAGFDLKNAERDFLAQFAQGEYGEPAEFAADEEPEGVQETELVPNEPDQADEPEIDPKYARGIERVVAREMAAKEAEQAAKREREAADARIAELKRYEGLKPTADLSDQFDLDPVGAFKSLGKDPDTMIKLALAQQLGDKAPAELKEFARKANDDLRYKKLEAKLAQKEQAEAAASYFNTIRAGAKEYVTGLDRDLDPKKPGKKVGDGIPTVLLAAKADPDFVHDEIMEEIVKDAQKRAAVDPNGDPMTYAEAASRVEARLSRIAKLLVPNGTNTANKNGHKPSSKSPPISTKPAAKPLAPWKQPHSSIENDGIQEALRAYELAEAERKAARR